MKKYTRQQLLKAQQLWNLDLVENPDTYEDGAVDTTTTEYAERQVDHLLSFVDKE